MHKTNTESLNLREVGATKLKASHEERMTPEFPHTGDKGDEPKEPFGLTEGVNESHEDTMVSDSVDQHENTADDEAFVSKDLLNSRSL
ncbi:hypothetical protein [Tianweitania sediminis]|jgi:hypothetical protein|uniref:Uncharacterized protein n=1 Tax=Tianweitania sediminis TaxID=1502156 RepID=A0A8J7R0Q9_9HYPH|nr:hypothetical protein [Tianweitania sediminis]MBP0439835.1 hypothetical protein [Tianweitania sediminis]HEV7416969.1 hypothetical protein [Tianweitania sediminis]